jgi:hypothetical protein
MAKQNEALRSGRKANHREDVTKLAKRSKSSTCLSPETEGKEDVFKADIYDAALAIVAKLPPRCLSVEGSHTDTIIQQL